jgi:hypothetical protein
MSPDHSVTAPGHPLSVEPVPGGSLFTCSVEGCGRRLALDVGGRPTVIDAGDQFARHYGPIGGGVEFLVEVRPTPA